MKYIITNKDGLVTESGVRQPSYAPVGAIEVDALPLPHNGSIFWVDGKYIYSHEPVVRPSVETSRMAQYPAIGDQLGAIWKAIAPLIDHPEAKEILAKIQAVKDANPKQ